MMADATNSEYLLAHKVAQDYRSKGYEVSRDVPLDFLPGFRADLIARKDGDTVVVEVKGRSALSANPKIRELATILETKPGWSFELLLVGEPERLDSLEGARSFEYKGILDRLGEAEKALGVGLAEAAFVLAWSAPGGSSPGVDRGAGRVEPAYYYNELCLGSGIVFRGYP